MSCARRPTRPACLEIAALRMAVNLPAAQFADNALVAHFESVLQRAGMPAQLLELEITETAVMHEIDRALALLVQVKRLGVFISIDDFGTGYSSLTQLRELPVDNFNIDRSLINQLPDYVRNAATYSWVIGPVCRPKACCIHPLGAAPSSTGNRCEASAPDREPFCWLLILGKQDK